MREPLRSVEECFHRDRTVSCKGTSQKLGCGGGGVKKQLFWGFCLLFENGPEVLPGLGEWKTQLSFRSRASLLWKRGPTLDSVDE